MESIQHCFRTNIPSFRGEGIEVVEVGKDTL